MKTPLNSHISQVATKPPKRKLSIDSSVLLKSETHPNESFGTPLNDLARLLLISYFPSGFWSRLMIRILADTQIADIAQKVYSDTDDVSHLLPFFADLMEIYSILWLFYHFLPILSFLTNFLPIFD